MEPTITVDPMKCPTMPCKCGRQARVHPETGKPFRHKVGRAHPAFPRMAKAKRRDTWCPETPE